MTEDRRTISIVNWDQFQSYNSKSNHEPEWVKLYGGTLLSRTWRQASNIEKATMIVLLILAARTDNKIANDPDYIADVGGIKDGVILDHFFATGFIDYTDNLPEEPEEKPKRAKRKPKPKETEAFVAFYDRYPRHVKRQAAWAAWQKNDCEESAARIMANVEARLRGEWKGKDPQYIWHPSTYLNQRLWEEEPEQGTRVADNGDVGTLDPNRVF